MFRGFVALLAAFSASPALATYSVDCSGAGDTPYVEVRINGAMEIIGIAIRSRTGTISSDEPGHGFRQMAFPAGLKAELVNRRGSVIAHLRLTEKTPAGDGYAGVLLLAHRKYWLACEGPG